MRAHCERCDREVEGEHLRPRMRKVAYGYLLLIVPFIPLLPIIAADYIVMIPTLMLYMLGIGPVVAIIREPPVCTECGALLLRGGPSRALAHRRRIGSAHATQPGDPAGSETPPPT